MDSRPSIDVGRNSADARLRSRWRRSLESKSIGGRSKGSWESSEKKTADAREVRFCSSASERVPFVASGGAPQRRYERLRAYVLMEPDQRPRVSPAQFDLRRLNRFGMAGLVDHAFPWDGSGAFEVEVIPMGAEDAEDRMARLCEFLARMVSAPKGGDDATCRPVRQGLDGLAGEGAGRSRASLQRLRGLLTRTACTIRRPLRIRMTGTAGRASTVRAWTSCGTTHGKDVFDVVVVLCPDRLARRYAYQVLLLEELTARRGGGPIL